MIEDEINKLPLDLNGFIGKAQDLVDVLSDWKELDGMKKEEAEAVKDLFTKLLVDGPDTPAFTGSVSTPNAVMLMTCCFNIGRRYEVRKHR